MSRFTTALLTAALLLAAPLAAEAAAETYNLDPAHTSVLWTINHFGFSNPQGKFAGITGTLTLDEEHPENSKVSATIPIAGLASGVDKLNEHLLSPDFFDAKQFPTATFVSSKVTRIGKNGANVDGILTLHGVSKPVTLSVRLNKIGENMMKKKTAGFSITTVVKRSDFGMTKYLPMLGDLVSLSIESEANLAQ